MPQLFISHVEEDETVALDVAHALEAIGYTTWYYERDSVPGTPYLDQAAEAIEEASAFLLFISRGSLGAHQVTAEIIHAFEKNKAFVPLLSGISHREFQGQNRTWKMALGAWTSIAIPTAGASSILDRIA